MIRKERNYGCRLSEFSICGIPAFAMENELMRIGILAGKGGDIYEWLHKGTDTDLMYRSRDGLWLLNKPVVSIENDSGSFWENFAGGWFEMIPNAGNGCVSQRASIGLHGEAMMLPWMYEIVEDSADAIAVKLSVHCLRKPLRIEKTLRMTRDSGVLVICETVENTSRSDVSFMWGHHITMGEAFLNEYCVIDLAPSKVIQRPEYHCSGSRLAPSCEGTLDSMPGGAGGQIDLRHIPPCGKGVSETLFVEFVKDCWFRVSDRRKQLSFRVSWQKDVFPSMWIWQEFNYTQEYPFYGDGYAMALEPLSGSTPVLSAAEKDHTCHILRAGEIKSTILEAELVWTGVGNSC